MCVGLEVTDKATILESLDAFVAGELLAGDNAFFCDTCGKAVRGLWGGVGSGAVLQMLEAELACAALVIL
jgi:hypothetical protein